MAVRLRDVAERAGVSVRTVSNVVNDFVHVAPSTRRRVQLAVEELGYQPNVAARQLRRGRAETISLVVPEIDSPYFAELASLLVRAAEARGWTVHIDQTDGRAERELRLTAGAGRAVDGVICSPWAIEPDELVDRARVPLVLLGERAAAGPVDHVAIDNVSAGRAATEHLLTLGRRHIAAIGLQPHLRNNTAVLRRRGYLDALATADVPPTPELQVPVEALHRADGAWAMAHLLESSVPVDALFCFTDQLALGALRVLADHGIRVPHDIAVVGFDNVEDGRYSVPSLTTIAPDKQQIAELALDRLAARIDSPDACGRADVARHALLVRESTAGR